MSQYNSVVNFSIGMSNVGAAVQELQGFGRELDKIEAKKQKLAKPASGGAGGASDRQINKALKQDSVGDLLEGLGISDKTLAVMKTGGLAVFGFTAALKGMSDVMNGLASNKAASEIWTDIAKGLPIIGGLATAADEAGRAIANYVYGTDLVIANAKAIDASIDMNRKGFDSAADAVKKYGKELQDALDRQELANAKPEDRAGIAARQRGNNEGKAIKDQIAADVAAVEKETAAAKAALRKKIADTQARNAAAAEAKNNSISMAGPLGAVVGSAGVVTVDQISTAAMENQIATNEEVKAKRIAQIKAAGEEAARETAKANAAEQNRAAIDAATQTEKEITRRIADEERERTQKAKEAERERAQNAKEAAQDKAKLNEQLMRGSAQLLDEISGLEDKQREKMLGIGRQTRMGALAAGGGIGTANQLASQQRASFNPALKLMQDAAKKDDEKLKYLRGLWEASQRGEFTPIFN